jgi:hypothetical protein
MNSNNLNTVSPVVSSPVVATNALALSANYTLQVHNFVNSGKKIPPAIFNQNPALCLSIRKERNEAAAASHSALLASGYNFKAETVSKSGRVASLKYVRQSDGGLSRETALAKQSAELAELKAANEKLAAQLAQLLAATLEKGKDLNAENV